MRTWLRFFKKKKKPDDRSRTVRPKNVERRSGNGRSVNYYADESTRTRLLDERARYDGIERRPRVVLRSSSVTSWFGRGGVKGTLIAERYRKYYLPPGAPVRQYRGDRRFNQFSRVDKTSDGRYAL